MSWSDFSGASKTAVVTAVLGFIISITSINTVTSNGVLTACSFMDFGALLLGGIAAIAGLIGASAGMKAKAGPIVAISLITAAVGAYHILRGIGMVGGPCN